MLTDVITVNAGNARQNDLYEPESPPVSSSGMRAERRLSRAVPVYAAPDQDVCGVDMSMNSVHVVAI
jgi:hypothetical protein